CSGEQVGPAADIYSLGVVAYEMLTGRPPFTAATPAAVIMAQLHNELPPPRSVNPSISAEVEGVLLKGLARVPAERYRRAGDFVRSLGDAADVETPAPASAQVSQAAVSPPLTPPPSAAPIPPATPVPTPLPYTPPTPAPQQYA